MKASCWQNHFLLWRSAPARQAGYASALGTDVLSMIGARSLEMENGEVKQAGSWDEAARILK